jgi:large-conductance mechanosensitive channel
MIIEQAALPYYFMIRKQFQCSAVNQPPQQWTIPAPNTNSECMDEIPDDTYDVKIESYFHVTGGSVWTHVIEHYCTNVVVDRTQPTSAEVCAYSETAQGTVWDPSYNWDEPTNWGLYIPYTKYVVAGLLAYGLTKEIVPTVIAIALAPVIGVAVGPLVEEELNKTNYLTSDDPEQQAMYNQLIVNAADGVAAAITAIIVMRIYQSASAKKQQRTVQKQTMFNPFAMQPYGYPVR